MSKLLLGSIQLDLDPECRPHTNALGVSGQQHGQARGYVAEGERLREMHEMPEPPSEGADDRVRDVGLIAIQIFECSQREKNELAVVDCDRRRWIGAAVEYRQLRDRAPGPST